ncbi:TetR/AcrR family transcriptional regulator [Agarilytica rhodophyticola]|uniref:TetR/AcrR family transcriptional regulator n=1 Tax=Agarilytica rhodophyticola TaxID=1737490 RepID=UPI000B341CB2|nr:TetR/AcrR family transcriptional regulator [Agarilytica rhodophyticola]
MTEKRTLSDQKREDILAAAIAEFDKRGFQKTSMDQVAKVANVSKRTVYNHFPSKDSLFREIIIMMRDQGIEATNYEYRSDQPLDLQLTTMAEKEMKLLQSKSFISLSRLILAECLHSPELAEKALDQIAQTETGLKRWLKEAQSDGRLQMEDVEFASTQFLSAIKACAFWPQVIGYGSFPKQEQSRTIIDSTVAMFLSYYQKA